MPSYESPRVAVTLAYDTDTDQIVVTVPGTDGDGDVELLRLDCRQLVTADRERLRRYRDPARPQPAPGGTPVTRR